jgi:L-cysteine S-thiosulfotransferase
MRRRCGASLAVGAVRFAIYGALLLAGCAAPSAPADDAGAADASLRASFRARGQAGLDRLEQTELQRVCSLAAGNAPPKDVAQRLQREALAQVQFPADDVWMGDWHRGEQIAQSGVGMQYSDPPDAPRGGNCYACHRLSGTEIAYGTIGPSLYRYRERVAPGTDGIRHTWMQIWNAHAFNACSTMPRFGDAGILSADQIRDLMALLLDPQSPVNR